MDKAKKEILITAILAIVLLFVVANNFKKKPAKKSLPVKIAAQETAAAGSPLPLSGAVIKFGGLDAKVIEQQKLRANMKFGRDPFQFSGEDAAYSGAGLVLKGVSLSKNKKSFATINQEIVQVGDIISGYKVLSIEKGKVFLGNDTQKFYLILPEEVVPPESMRGENE